MGKIQCNTALNKASQIFEIIKFFRLVTPKHNLKKKNFVIKNEKI